MQGAEGVRAREIVVRVKALRSPAGTAYRLDIYAEGEVVHRLPGESAGRGTIPRGSRSRPTSRALEALRARRGLLKVRLDGVARLEAILNRSGFLDAAGSPGRYRRHARRQTVGPAAVPTFTAQPAGNVAATTPAAPVTPPRPMSSTCPTSTPPAKVDPAVVRACQDVVRPSARPA